MRRFFLLSGEQSAHLGHYVEKGCPTAISIVSANNHPQLLISGIIGK